MTNQTTDPDSSTGLSFGIMDRKTLLSSLEFLEQSKNNRLFHFEAEQPNSAVVRNYRDPVDYLLDLTNDNSTHLKNYSSQITIFTLCPYTAAYGQRYGLDIHETFFPVFWQNPNISFRSRTYDFFYSGTIFDWLEPELEKIREMKQISSCIVSKSNSSVVTHRGVDYYKKMELMNASRVVLVHNTIPIDWLAAKTFLAQNDHEPKNENSLLNFELFGNLNNYLRDEVFNNNRMKNIKTELYSRLYLNRPRVAANIRRFAEQVGVNLSNTVAYLPQLKSRLFEAAAAGAMPLVINDNWNLHNRFFDSNSEIETIDWSNLADTLKQALSEKVDISEMKATHAHEKWLENYTIARYLDKIKNFIPKEGA